LKRGKLIALEGIDGSGKATQAKRIQDLLMSKGKEAIVTGEPVYESATGKMIKEILNSDEKYDSFSLQLIYSLDRSMHVSTLIEPALGNGTYVIADRYFMSTIAYAIATGVKGEQLDALKKVNSTFPYPDFVFILDVDADESAKRLISRSASEGRKVDRFEKIDFLNKVRNIYQKFQNEYKNTKIINGNRSIEDVSNDILEELGDDI